MPKPKELEKWKPESLRLEMAWVGNGVLLQTCFAVNCDAPVGSVWVRLGSNSYRQAVCEVIDIYVPKIYRRMGIASFMMKSLLDGYGILKTGTGSKDGGMALLKALGWKRNRQTGDWYLFGKRKRIAQ
ncbi:MAG TPA: GNAT family N-acetyltransferase [Tepidisphaeraceae bacterium]|jgi:hypothetical protein|nr:GNAT family N-acetyltransferase [Tepidisphaeraceae bacterium]